MALSGTLSGATTGFTIAGPWGALIGGALGLGTDIWGATLGADASKLQDEATALEYSTKAKETGVSVEEAKSNISAYEAYLANYGNYADLQKSTFEAQSRNEFKQLLTNMGLQDVSSGMTGRTGLSVEAAGTEAKAEVVDYAGADLSLDGGDGRYGMAKSELWNNLDLEKKKAEGQLNIYKTSLGVLQENQKLYQGAAEDYTEKANASGWDRFWNSLLG